MSGPDGIRALRRANPREAADVGRLLAEADAIRRRVLATPIDGGLASPARAPWRPAPRRRLVGLSAAGATLAAAAVAAALLTVGSPGGRTGVDGVAAAVQRAAGVSAASAERSGTATVRITRDGEPWAGTTIRWNDDDMAVSSDGPSRQGRAGSGMLVVDGILYGIDPRDGAWVNEGSPESIDPDSGTTPREYLAATREDVGGVTLRRITDGVTGLTTRRLADGGVAYEGTVPAGLVARETGVKQGRRIRVLPFGYVAHDEAADPSEALDVAVTVGADGLVHEIAVSWGGATAWRYVVSYSDLGATAEIAAPARARSLRALRSREG